MLPQNTPTDPSPPEPAPRPLIAVPEDWDPLSSLVRAQERLDAGDATALEAYFIGHRAGAAAERARSQLAAAEFGAYLGPAPRLRGESSRREVL